MNEVRMFDNQCLNLQVRTILNDDGSISISAEDTAIGFGWTQNKNGKVYVKWERLNEFCKEFGFSPQVGKGDYIPESLFYLLGMKANNERALKFQKWLAMDVLPALRQTGTYSMNHRQSVPFREQLEAAAFIAADLHVNEVSKLTMYQKLCESNHVSPDFLPDYAADTGREKKPITELLKQYQIPMTAAKFNQLLIAAGILEERERFSTTRKNGKKKFKVLTEKGLEYGENLVSKYNPKQSQPYYYKDKFLELYKILTQMEVLV